MPLLARPDLAQHPNGYQVAQFSGLHSIHTSRRHSLVSALGNTWVCSSWERTSLGTPVPRLAPAARTALRAHRDKLWLMTKTEYAAYLAGDHWQELRRSFLEDPDNALCARCVMPRWLAVIAYDQDLHVHHKTYANLGNEDWDDLESLCRRCHEIETFGRSDLRKLKGTNCKSCGYTHWNTYSPLCAECAFLQGAGAGGGEHLMDALMATDWGPESPVWKSVVRTICNILSCKDSGVDPVLEHLAWIDQWYRDGMERIRQAARISRGQQ